MPMKQKTRYRYEKRIKELEVQKRDLEERLNDFELTVYNIYDGIIEAVDKKSTGVSIPFLLSKIRRCLK